MKPEISIIIPTYNAAKFLRKCLEAIDKNTFKEKEVIIVDDASTDDTVRVAREFPCRIIQLEKNSGPAVARNRGAREARSDILFFLDSDVVLKPDALQRTYDFYKNHPSEVALIGMYAKEPANVSPFNYYMAYWKYATWTPPQKYFTFFIASIGSVKKETFLTLGGFNERYRGADVEDYEFGYKLCQSHKINLDAAVQGYHHYPTFKSACKNYFRRTSQWFEMFITRKKFDTGQAKALTGISFVFAALTIPWMVVLSIFPNVVTFIVALFPFLALFLFNGRFYLLILREKNIFFFIYAFLINYFFALIITSAAVHSLFRHIRSKIMMRNTSVLSH